MSKYISRFLVVLALGWAGYASSAHAALIELSPETSGVLVTAFPASGATHSRPLTTIRGYQAAMAQSANYASYLIFDTSNMAFGAQSATLFLNVSDTLSQLAGPGPLELWGLDTYTPADLVALPTGNLDTQASLAFAIAADLRSGTSLAPAVIGPDGVVGIELNDTALGQINAANGLWGLGLYDNRFGALLGGLELLSSPRLVLSGEPVSPPTTVPIPATLPIIGLGLAIIVLTRRKLPG